MNKRILAPTLLGLLAIGLACGGGDGTSSSSSSSSTPAAKVEWNAIQHCADIEVLSGCFDNVKKDLTEDECLIQVSYKAIPTDGACPTKGRVGSCQTDKGMMHYYSDGKRSYDKSRAKEWCKDIQEGKFVEL
jgi:hypothetical protein